MTTNAIRSTGVAPVALRALLTIGGLGWAHAALAQTAADLTRPTSTVELGASGVSSGSFKAGEFNGLYQKGGTLIGSVDVRGGGSYDSDSAMRFRLQGTDLGLRSRRVTAEAGVQGVFRVRFGYDSLRRSRSDSYETPLLGAGTNVLALPGTWLVPVIAGSTGANNAVTTTSARGLVPSIAGAPYLDVQTTSPTRGSLITPTAPQLTLVGAAAGADVPSFRPFDIFTTRSRYTAGGSLALGPHVEVEADVRPEWKTGTKLMGTVSRNTGGDIATIIPDPIDSRTNQVDLGVNLNGRRGALRAGYYGSFFTNNIPFVSWQNWATPAHSVNTMSSAPDNSFGQLNVTGSLNLSSTAKVVANAAYGRATQNDEFLTDASTPVVPVGSLNGLVVSSLVDVRFSAHPGKRLNLGASYRFDDRDNRTAVHLYQYADAGEDPHVNASFPAGSAAPLGAVVADNANANRPYSRRLQQGTADADYRLARGMFVHGAYEYQRMNRSCPGSWVACADAALTGEHVVRADWRAMVPGRLTIRAAYEYARRRTPDYNENAFLALVPYASVVPVGQSMSAAAALTRYGLTGYGPVSGYNGGVFVDGTFFPSNNALANTLYANRNRISELLGMRRYYAADRNRGKLRSLVNWDATDRLGLQAGVDYSNDDYPDATYGQQHSRAWAANVDSSLALSGQVSADIYYSYESLTSAAAGNTYTGNSNAASLNGFTGLSGNACDGYTTLLQRNNNAKLDPCLNYRSDMSDTVHTVGAGMRAKSGKLEIAANLNLSRARGENDVSGGNWANNPLALPGAQAGTVAAFFIAAAPMPTVTSDSAELRLNGWYTIGRHQSLRVLYSFLHMKSSDWMYEGMQIGLGTPSGVLPTNEQPFNYSVSIVGLSYLVTF